MPARDRPWDYKRHKVSGCDKVLGTHTVRFDMCGTNPLDIGITTDEGTGLAAGPKAPMKSPEGGR